MTSSFVEREPWERGFSALFARDIAPRLAELEGVRLAILARRNRRLGLVAAAALAGIVAALVLVADPVERLVWLSLVAILVGIAALALASAKSRTYAHEVKAAIMPAIASHLGLAYDPAAAAGPDAARFVEIGLLSRFANERRADGLSGSYRGVSFALCGAVLDVRERSRHATTTRTVFRGMLLAMATRQNAPGTIVIGPDLGPLTAVLGALRSFFRGLQPVKTGHAAFDARFDVRAQEPKSAALYLSVPFLDTLVALAAQDGVRAVKAAFVADRLHIAIARAEPVIAVGPLSESLDQIEPRVHRMLADASFPLRLIDGFLGSAPQAQEAG